MSGPDPAMLAVPEAIARFIAGGPLEETIFAAGGPTIVENFAPFIFQGQGAAERWRAGMRAHAEGLSGLRHAFGEAQDFAREGERVFFTLPTTWRGRSPRGRFEEQGGWAFVLDLEDGAWKLAAYGWAVTSFRSSPS